MDVAHCYLDGNADAVEFCPHDNFHGVLSVATYTLQEGDKPSRNGSISLFDVDAEMGRLELFHRVDTAGIFDIKWNPQVGGSYSSPMLAQADADGYMKLHGFEFGSNGTEGSGNVAGLEGEVITCSFSNMRVDFLWHLSIVEASNSKPIGNEWRGLSCI